MTEIKNSPSVKQLKTFGLIWALIFLVIFYHYKNIVPLLASIAFISTSLLKPSIFEQIKFYQYWVKFGNFIGKINSLIIIAFLYFMIFIPAGIIIKILRKDLLKIKLDKSAKSYFVDRQTQPISMKNQF